MGGDFADKSLFNYVLILITFGLAMYHGPIVVAIALSMFCLMLVDF